MASPVLNNHANDYFSEPSISHPVSRNRHQEKVPVPTQAQTAKSRQGEDPSLVYPPPHIYEEYKSNASVLPFARHRDIKSSVNAENEESLMTSSVAGIGRTRSKSFTEAVAEKAIHKLAPPVNFLLVALCVGWYAASAISSTLTKTILTQFPYPVTLTLVQFFLSIVLGVSTILLSQLSHRIYKLLPVGTVSHRGLRFPTREILASTLPMGVFQLIGHIFSHKATSLIPLSLVHTIKALSPLFTVIAYRVLVGIKYPLKTYLSLLPLMTGVIMTCSTQFSAQMQGIFFALCATLVFVSQNMYSKRLLTYRPESTSGVVSEDSVNPTPRIDKLNILCYCSSLAFVFTLPLWIFSEGRIFASDYINQQGKFFTVSEVGHTTSSAEESGTINGPHLVSCFLVNGLSHFLQNLFAFQVLGIVSPVTYTVASLCKRIGVITFAIFWFGQRINALQGWGIGLTFFGLYLYDRLGGDNNKQSRYANMTLQSKLALPK